MEEDVKKRLKDTGDQCLKSYEAWEKDKKSTEAQEALQEAVHDLRKVASRLEIELALNERDQMAQKPIPVPPHRAAKGRRSQNDEKDMGGMPDADDSRGNGGPPSRSSGGPRRRGPRKAAGGNS